MDKQVFFEIKKYLKENRIAEIDGEPSKMLLRKEGKVFSTEEHLQGMIYSMLSAQTVWANIERHFEQIDKLFFYYNLSKIKAKDGTYFVRGLQSLGCGSRLTNAQMRSLNDNIATIEKIIKEYGSMDAFVTSKPQREIVALLSSSTSQFKIKQLGPALAWEYLRNVGIDGAKPDVHMKRILGVKRLGISNNEEASDDEVLDAVEALSKETGYWMAEIDYLFWAYCASGKGEICTANPRCNKCVINQYCRKNCTVQAEVETTKPQEEAVVKTVTAKPSASKLPMKYDALKRMKKDIRAGLVQYMATKDPGKSESTYKMYASDSNYLLNNNQEDAYISFMRSDEPMPEIKELIRTILVEHRGEAKVTDGGAYYYKKLCWQREYIKKIGGIDALISL